MTESSELASDLPTPSAESATAERIKELLSPIVDTAEAELLDVEWAGGTLRLVVDGPDGTPVSTGALTQINRLVSPILDQHDPISSAYVLEVSSPGVERPLRRVEHFHRAVGERVILKLLPGEDPRRIKGELQAVSEGSAERPASLSVAATEFDGAELKTSEVIEVPLSAIDKARTAFDWGPTPKKGGKAGNKKKPNNKSGNKKRASGTPNNKNKSTK